MLQRGDTEREGNLVVVDNHMVAVLVQPDRVTLYDFARQRDKPISGLWLIEDLELGAVHLNNRGAEKLRSGQIREAIADLEVAVRLAPEFTAPYANLGVARGDVEGALAVYRRALEIDAGDPTVLNNLASLYRSVGRPEEASAAVQAADLSGASPYFLITRGDLERSQGNYRKARRLYRRAHRRAPELPDPLVALARLELERERPRAARKALDRALERDPDHPAARRLERRFSGEGRARR